MKIADLEHGACLRVLLLLKDGSALSGREIGEHVNYRTFLLTRKILIDLELIHMEQESGSRRIMHRLSKKGISIAALLVKIENLLQGETG